MALLETAVDPRAQSYLDARAAMLAALAELDTALDAAREGGGERAVTRHHARGKLLARERIELLVDRDSPLLELSPMAGWGTGTPIGAAVVTAVGVIEDRACLIIASDPTVRGGAVNAATLRKILRAQEIAHQNRLPVVGLIEATGYELAEHSEIFVHTGRVVAGFAQLSAARIPTVGTFFGDWAELVGSFDQLVRLAPPAAGRPADHLAEDERDALRLTRHCVRRLPVEGGPAAGPAGQPVHDPEDLLAVPASEPREILARLLDSSEFDEVQPGYGTAVCAGWGTLHGHRVAVLADATGASRAEEVDKSARLVRHAEATRTPLLFLRHGSLPAAGAEAAVTAAVSGAAVPAVTVRVGGWHGLASVGTQARFRFAWPNAHAALAGPGGSDPASALYLSGQLADDGIIDPRDTRTVLGFCLSVSLPGSRQ
jgi:acetyl-CoA carboxylase carboxyltransferase component